MPVARAEEATTAGAKAGYIDKMGNMAISLDCDYGYVFTEDGIAMVFKGARNSYGNPEQGLYGFVDTSGQWISELQWTNAHGFSQGFAGVQKDGKWGYIDTHGEVAIELQFDYARPFGACGRAVIFQGSLGEDGYPNEGVYGLLDQEGRVVCEPQWDEINSFSQGLAAVKQDDKWGFINTQGEVVVAPQWDYVEDFTEDGFATVFTGKMRSRYSPDNGKYGFVNKAGQLLGDMEWDDADSFSQGLAVVEQNRLYGFINTQGEIVIAPQWAYAHSFREEGLAVVIQSWDSERCTFIDKEGNVVIDIPAEMTGFFSLGFVTVKQNGKWGCINTQGEMVVKPEWDFVEGYEEDGMAIVFNGTMAYSDFLPGRGRYGVVNQAGELVTNHWSKIDRFSQGLARVWRNGKIGYIDLQGNLVIEPMYDETTPFANGFAFVKIDPTLVDFKKIAWGATKEQAVAMEGETGAEGTVPDTEAVTLSYNRTLCDVDSVLTYFFGPEGLYQVQYTTVASYDQLSTYVADYQKIRETLSERYLFLERDKQEVGLEEGYLNYAMSFASQRTDGLMKMIGDSQTARITVTFQSRWIADPLPVKKDFSNDF